jgi:hypothetical protein
MRRAAPLFDGIIEPDNLLRAFCRASRGEMRASLAHISQFLSDDLRLTLKPTPYWNRSVHGVDFLGVRVFPSRLVLNRRSRVRFRRKLRALELALARGEIGELEMQQRATSLVEFTEAGGLASWNFRRKVLESLAAAVDRLEPGEPGRELEQLRQELPFGEPYQEQPVEPEQQPGLPRCLELRRTVEVP